MRMPGTVLVHRPANRGGSVLRHVRRVGVRDCTRTVSEALYVQDKCRSSESTAPLTTS